VIRPKLLVLLVEKCDARIIIQLLVCLVQHIAQLLKLLEFHFVHESIHLNYHKRAPLELTNILLLGRIYLHEPWETCYLLEN